MPSPVSGGLLAPALLGAVLGPAVQLQQPQLWPLAAYAALLALGLAVLAWGARRSRQAPWVWCVVLLAVAVLSGSLAGLRAGVFAGRALAPALEGRDLRLTGVVTAMPQPTDAGLRFRFRVEAARLGEAEVRLPPEVLLGWYGGIERRDSSYALQSPAPALVPGERWQLTARLKAPHGHVNPHGFDYELWLWEHGLQATGYVRAGPRDPPPQLLERSWQAPVERLRDRTRSAIFARVPQPQQAGVLAALVVGDQRAIERADWDVFRATGVAHLMSISGLHVTMFAWAAALAVGGLWRRSVRLCLWWPAQHAALVGGLGLAAAYALFSGWGVPAQRTIWMLACVAGLRLAARDWPWPWVWLLACAVVVTLDPWSLTQPGFWLSFIAVGVLFASAGPQREDARGPATAARLGGRARDALYRMLHEQWVVTVALTPLSLLLFGQVSVVGLAANLLAIPWVTLVITPLGLLGVLLPPLWSVAGWCVQALAALLGALAALPWASASAPAAPLWAGVAGVAGGVLLSMRLPWAARSLGLPLLLPVLLWQPPRPAPGDFELLAADVGQGNALLVRTARHTLVYDAGPAYSRETDAGQRVLLPLLRAGADRLDLLVLSHGDQDHTGGAAALLRMQPQAALLASLGPADPLPAGRMPAPCQAGQAWRWDGVDFQVLHPPPGEAPARRSNARSCVLRIANARGAALLAGDIERPQEALLARQPAAVRADFLLVPHHGSKTSSSAAFLDAVQPRVAFAQAGYRNRFGHPAAEVVARYRERGILLHATPACGAARWRPQEPGQVTCERARAPRYWRHRPP